MSESSPARAAIERCLDDDRAALVGYWPAGFPDVKRSVEVIQAMVEAGVDVVEVGLPYSDPVMDGPAIQQATQRALAAGMRVRDVFGVVEAVASMAPALVMTYWNPVEVFGVEPFAEQLAAVGGAGLITPDLIPDEADEWLAASDRHGLDRVFLVAPSSTDARLAQTTAVCRGFVYATSLMGVTGTRAQVDTAAATIAERTRRVATLPVGVGLGVSTGRQAAEVAGYADAVIVGSAFVRCLLDTADHAAGLDAVRELTVDLAAGVRRRPTR